jgi:hypothetical protein
MAAPARVPRRGERGFKAAMEAQGGDPRLLQARERRLRPVEAPGRAAPAVPTRESRQSPNTRPGAARGRARALTERPVPVAGISVNDGAGFVLGVLAWVLTVQYLQHGVPGVKAWLRAKFLNRTTGARPR